jgi:hypothetical protein
VLGLVCAKAAFDVVARTRNPAAITAATIVNNFVVLMIYISTFFYSRHLYKVYLRTKISKVLYPLSVPVQYIVWRQVPCLELLLPHRLCCHNYNFEAQWYKENA